MTRGGPGGTRRGRLGTTLAWRRGLTFMETIGATVILALLAAVMFSAFNSMIAGQVRQRQRLACAEVANRLILQYLDDPDTMPPPSYPVEYEGERFRWELERTPVERVWANPEFIQENAGPTNVSVTDDRLEHVGVRVWLAEESGGSYVFDALVPHASMGRLIDPLGMRNPDTIEHIFGTPGSARYQRFMEEIARFSNSGGGSRRERAPARSPGGAAGGERPK
ncbi:MAG: type II secretion system protein [Planctomycetota bacterium]|nr:type II secretion system protein [Planctomycetota bacterium]